VPIDISADFLYETAQGLRQRYPHIQITPVVGDFTQDVALPETANAMEKIAFFPGSTIGNIPRDTAVALLSNARAWPQTNGFVLGLDLVKDPFDLVKAYDDGKGVTAAFIGNILARLNRDLAANFDLRAFAYQASWHPETSRISMKLVSLQPQTVLIQGTEISFAKNEPIQISEARKFTPETIRMLAEDAGWQLDDLLTDTDKQFAVAVLRN